MKNAIVFGAGNIGTVLIEKLKKESVNIKCVVRSGGIFDLNGNKIGEQKDWINYIDKVDVAFICIPTKEKGEQAFQYEIEFLKKGKPVITCEKASIANNWEELKNYKNIFKYTASVGGGTKILKKISENSPQDIKEIKAVVNGTLNYISTGLLSGKSKEEIVKEVLEKGFAEPGATSFDEIIKGELKDVVLKSVIIANHSGLFEKTVKPSDINIVDFKEDKRCIVKITRNEIEVGFIENNDSQCLPDGVNNILFVNGEEKVCGPGAGAEATVSAMISDLFDLFKI